MLFFLKEEKKSSVGQMVPPMCFNQEHKFYASGKTSDALRWMCDVHCVHWVNTVL